MTLGDRLTGRDNALNAVRLALAVLVILDHAWPLGGFGAHSGVGGASLGTWAVGGFFAVSGYLVAGSRDRLRLVPYLWRRALRIFPGFWVCLLVIAGVFAPVSAWASGQMWRPSSSLQFVLTNAGLWVNQWGVEDTLQSVPYPYVWDGSLWTLAFEFLAYLSLGALFIGKWARTPWSLGALLVLALVAEPLAHGPLDVTTNVLLNAVWLGGFFLAGSFLWSIRDRTPLSGWLALSAAASLILIGYADMVTILAPLPWAYLVLWAGAVLPIRLGRRNDLSYGIYIYAFPVQQLLAISALPSLLGPWGSATIAALLTVPLAAASWWVVEKPALRWNRLVGSAS